MLKSNEILLLNNQQYILDTHEHRRAVNKNFRGAQVLNGQSIYKIRGTRHRPLFLIETQKVEGARVPPPLPHVLLTPQAHAHKETSRIVHQSLGE